MIRKELQRAEQCSTTAHRTAALTTTIDTFSRNGYTKKWLTAKKQRRKKRTRQTIIYVADSVCLRITEPSDKTNPKKTRHTCKAHQPSESDNQRSHKTKKGKKKQKNVQANSVRQLTYVTVQTLSTWPLVTCAMRHYVGMTIRKLHHRAYEHLLSARKRANKTAIEDGRGNDTPKKKERK